MVVEMGLVGVTIIQSDTFQVLGQAFFFKKIQLNAPRDHMQPINIQI